jgi:hypothetical protein
MSSLLCDERHALTWDYVKNTLVAIASCDTTCKKYFASLANDNKIVCSSRYDVHWFALLFAIPRGIAHSLACLLAQYDEKCIIVVRSLRYNIKTSSSRIIARDASSSHPRNVTAKNIDVVTSCDMTKICSRKRWHKSRMVAQKRGHKPTTSRLVCISTSFFQGKIFETRLKKGRKKIAGSKVKSVMKNRISEILLS